MGKGDEQLHAPFGKWSYTLKDGQVEEFRGVFAPKDREHATGTAAFLHNGFITNTEKPRWPERYSDALVVRLRRDRGDNMEKFQHWAEEHDLMPLLQKELDEWRERQDRKAWQEELYREEEKALAFHPVAKPRADRTARRGQTAYAGKSDWDFLKNVISNMHWQLLETGYPDPAKPHTDEALVTVTSHPELAFQAAHYLKEEQFIDDVQFARLNRDIKAARHAGNQEPEFRISVTGENVGRFMEAFSKAGSLQATLGYAQLERISQLSQPPRDSAKLR